MFGTAAIHSPAEPNPELDTVRCVRTGEVFTARELIDRDFARLAHENIQRRTYAVMKGLA